MSEEDVLDIQVVSIEDLTWESIDIFNQNFLNIQQYVENLTTELGLANEKIVDLETEIGELTLRVEALEPPEEEGVPE